MQTQTKDDFNRGHDLGFSDIKLTYKTTLDFAIGYRRGCYDLLCLREANYSAVAKGLNYIVQRARLHVSKGTVVHLYLNSNYKVLYRTKEKNFHTATLIGMYNAQATKAMMIEDIQAHLQELAEC